MYSFGVYQSHLQCYHHQWLILVQHLSYSTQSSSMLSPSIADSGSASVLQYTVNTLVPETIYIFQVIARNNVGDSSSKSMTCTTDICMYVLI